MSESEWDAWDRQIEEDLILGRLDKLLQEVDDAHKKGLTLPICRGKRNFYQAQSAIRRNDEQ